MGAFAKHLLTGMLNYSVEKRFSGLQALREIKSYYKANKESQRQSQRQPQAQMMMHEGRRKDNVVFRSVMVGGRPLQPQHSPMKNEAMKSHIVPILAIPE
jgi:predicted lipid-binding transport protein (Tim44 family)